ncbi:MAG TPA: hypothetical protein VMC09_08615 [Anaerolineales bacterium]|nr:hypothetical protein [Anaerolineales bacterium]
MKKKIIPFFIFILMALACNLPSKVSVPDSSLETPTSTEEPLPTHPPAPTGTPSPTFLQSDLPFTIDCKALPASRQADCDAFIATTRDQVYPILREVTGVSLSKCYQSIHYIILDTDPVQGGGGISAGDTITLNRRYSIDLPHRYDVHELLHSASTCAGALDQHIFHGMIMNYVYDRLGVHDPGYLVDKSSSDLTDGLNSQLESVKTASGTDLVNACKGILARKMTLLFFSLDEQSIRQLYRSTIPPLKVAAAPNAKLVEIWGSKAKAEQVEALLETLKQEEQISFDVPECGY